MKTKLLYLGFLISREGLKMDQEKVKAIINWPTPRSISEVRIFHGLASFYRKFIKKLNGICAPIVETIKEKNQSEETNKSFQLVKKNVTEKPILALLDFNKLFQAETDASGTARGVVLSQEGKPISYFSEKINEAKQK